MRRHRQGEVRAGDGDAERDGVEPGDRLARDDEAEHEPVPVSG